MSSVSTSRLDDTDVEIRQMVEEFRKENGSDQMRLKAIADINFMIGSASSFLKRHYFRERLRCSFISFSLCLITFAISAFGIRAALESHTFRTPKNNLIDAEVETYLLSEERDFRLTGLPTEEDRSPIEMLSGLIKKTNEEEWNRFVSGRFEKDSGGMGN